MGRHVAGNEEVGSRNAEVGRCCVRDFRVPTSEFRVSDLLVKPLETKKPPGRRTQGFVALAFLASVRTLSPALGKRQKQQGKQVRGTHHRNLDFGSNSTIGV
jgi:hypothetical protein